MFLMVVEWFTEPARRGRRAPDGSWRALAECC